MSTATANIPAICGRCQRLIMPGEPEDPPHDGKRFHANDCKDVKHWIRPPPVKPMGHCAACNGEMIPSQVVLVNGLTYHEKCAKDRGLM